MTVATPPLTLRWYQRAALDATFAWFQEQTGNALIVLPTGSGKSAVLSAFLAEARENYPALTAIVLATRGELVQQNARAARLFLPPDAVGIYSASVGIKQTDRPITVANIQSVAKRVFDLPAPDLIVVDEAQDIADADEGLYRTFFRNAELQNPHVKVVGLTATPYKLSSGRLDQGPRALFAGIAYEAPVARLIEEGYLCRPITPRTATQIDLSTVAVRGGEFVAKDLAQVVDVDATTEAACDEMVRRFADRKKWLIFACGVDHARHIAEALERRGVPAGMVHGGLSRDERAYRLAAFSRGEIRALSNADLLTVGYDEPAIDALALMRPTQSAGLYVQMIGRGMRVHPSKTDCLVADFASLIERFGPIDAIRIPDKKKRDTEGDAIVKVCPACETYVPAGVRVCPSCAHEFPPPPVQLAPVPSTAPILSTDTEPRWVGVTSVEYSYHEPRPPKTIPTLKATYYDGFRIVGMEWVCVEHEGFARTKAEQWWRRRSPDPCPHSVTQALPLTNDFRTPTSIALRPRPGSRYDDVVDVRFADDQVTEPEPCVFCRHFASTDPRCTLYQETPPVDVQATGCPSFTPDEPELPF